jgi:hypothetical protein
MQELCVRDAHIVGVHSMDLNHFGIVRCMGRALSGYGQAMRSMDVYE